MQAPNGGGKGEAALDGILRRSGELLTQAGACAWGCADGAWLLPRMSEDARARALERTPGLRRLLCAAFPYARGDEAAGRFSRYARGEDYHRAIMRRLAPVAEALEELCPGAAFTPWADSSPFPEVYAAARCGVGRLGKNGLLLTEAAGSYVFLGFLATNAPLPATGGEITSCRGCGLCERSCPGGALHGGAVDPEKCLSALTQKRGALTPEQENLLRRGGMLWGCDRCQLCCPENQGLTAAPLPEFHRPEPLLTDEDLALGDRAFRRKFDGRAFVWRGVQPLRRNAALLREDDGEDTSADHTPHGA